MREKDEWRFATMEYGGQCVTTAGTRWMLVWSVQSSNTLEVGVYMQIINLLIFQALPMHIHTQLPW